MEDLSNTKTFSKLKTPSKLNCARLSGFSQKNMSNDPLQTVLEKLNLELEESQITKAGEYYRVMTTRCRKQKGGSLAYLCIHAALDAYVCSLLLEVRDNNG